ncbi:MAG: DNA ligase D [Bacillota bacterium]
MTKELNEYNQKRDFQKTGEPTGAVKEGGDALSFVIQHHIARRDHYDFRLEWKGTLLSWAVPKGPSYNTADKRLAIKVEDHPIDYKDFEGTIPKGQYGGGVVMLWDEGEWQPYGDVDEGLEKGSIKFTLKGNRLKGKWALVKLKEKEGDKGDNWILLKEKDEYAKDDDGISEFTTSIRTGRTMDEIEKGAKKNFINNPFDNINVQLAKLVDKVPLGDDWLYEPKYDGYRVLAYVEENNARLMSRNQKDFTENFKEIALSLSGFANGRAMVFDGEMAVIDSSGKTDFQALQNHIKNRDKKKLTYLIFDLLALDGEDLRDKPLIERKKKLVEVMKDAPKNLFYSQHVEGKGKECFLAACQTGMEGIVGKKPRSLYKGVRNDDWIKIKCDNRQEFVVGGYTLSDKKGQGVSSLILGVYENGKLVYAGRAGTGFTQKEMLRLEEKFKAIITEKSPFDPPPKAGSAEKIFWLEPRYVAEIKFTEWTKENLLRQASYKGLREDKNPRDVVREKANNNNPTQERNDMKKQKDVMKEIKITSPDKVVFQNPKITKLQIIEYYHKVADRILPYLENRILSIVRCPKGVNEPCFFKKHPQASSKGIKIISVTNKKNEKDDYFYITDTLGLIGEAQMGTLEFHTWGSRVEDIEKPDIMVFDLDPDKGMDLDNVRRGVKDLKSILDELSLKSFLKTSGGKGYHIVLPFKPSVDWQVFHDFAKNVAEVMEKKWPDRYTSNVRKANRKNKIFVDWIRNGRGATSVAPYSLRAREGAKVSVPITWDELNSIPPDGFDMEKTLQRITQPDPWKDFFEIKQELK